MSATKLFTLRLPADDFALLEREAARAGLPVSTFARERMMSETRVLGEIDALRQEVRRLTAGAGGGASTPSGDAVSIKSLLLLRRASPPQAVAQVHGELTRHGLAAFQTGEG